MNSLTLLLTALVATILIEYGVLLLLGERRRNVLLGSVVVNVLTNVPLNLYVIHHDIGLTGIALAEGLVVVAEALWYFAFTRSLGQSCVYSLLCNAVSFLTGLLFTILSYYYSNIINL